MKNKLLLTLLALVCVISCVFALVACDPSGKPNNPNGNGNTGGDTIIGVEVTAEQWSEILDGVNNFILEMTKDGKFYGSVKFDGVKRHLLTDFDEEEIYNKDDDSRYCYVKAGESKWYLIKGSYDDYAHLNLLGEFADYYTQFTYSDGTYVAQSVDRTDPDNKTYSNAKAVFANGTLASLELDVTTSWEDTETSNTIKYTYKDIGKVTITIPTDIIGDDDKPNPDTAQVTEAEWRKLLDNESNFTVESYGDGEKIGAAKFDGYKREITSYSSKNKYSKEGDKYYDYYLNDGVWLKQEISETNYINYAGFGTKLLSVFKEDFKQFTFVDDVYVADTIDKKDSALGNIVENVTVTFKNGALIRLAFEIHPSSHTIHYIVTEANNTTVELPEKYTYVEPITCPIADGEKIKLPIGTKISAFYEQYPTLITDDGKWELYVEIDGAWRKMTDNDAVPYEKQFVCKLVFNGEAVVTPNDVLFFIVGTQGGDQTVQGEEVTAEQWAAILGDANNFTSEIFAKYMNFTVKIDGDTMYQAVGDMKIIGVQNGNQLDVYRYEDSVWTKTVSQNDETSVFPYSTLISMFQEDFAEFTYSNGTYTADSIDKSDLDFGVIQNIKIVFADGALISVEFCLDGDSSNMCSIYDIGNTVIEIPTDYVDQTEE